MAEGIGGDYSVCSVIAVTDDPHFEVLMTIRSRDDNPTKFTPKMVKYLLKYFSTTDADGDLETSPMLCVERNGPGHSVVTLLTEDEDCYYDNLYWHFTPNEKPDKTFKPGFTTNRITRINILQRLFNIFHQRLITLNDKTTATELQTLVRNAETGKVEHETGKNDDCVFALALAIQAWTYNRPSNEPLTKILC